MSEKFLPFIPMDQRFALASGKELVQKTFGTALFADISGFTGLTRIMIEELGQQEGAEEILRLVNPVYEDLIAEVHHYSGSVIGFAGDAILCWFDEGQGNSAWRAATAAFEMQHCLSKHAQIRTQKGTFLSLGIKIAMASGAVSRFVVGDPSINRIDVIAGSTIMRMAAAENKANTGEIIVSRVGWEDFDGKITWGDDRGTAVVMDSIQLPHPPVPWSMPTVDQDNRDILKSWIFPSIRRFLESDDVLPSDLRAVTPLFLRFGGIDFDKDDGAVHKLNEFIVWVQQCVTLYDGTLIQLTVGDKGAYLYAAFGAPHAHSDDPRRAMLAALTLLRIPSELEYIERVQIGLSRGIVWTGRCGSTKRHCYGVMGPEVNICARLMMNAKSGTIIVSSAMFEPSDFLFESLGKIVVKGVEEPLSAYRLLREKTTDERFFVHEMVGREEELSELQEFIDPVFRNRCAGCVVVYGDGGVGKSHLIYTFKQSIKTDMNWFTGKADNILQQPLNPFIYWLKEYFNQSVYKSVDENRQSFEEQLDDLIHRLTDCAAQLRKGNQTSAVSRSAMTPQKLVTELWRVSSFLGGLLGLYWPDSLYTKMKNDPQLRYLNTLNAIKTLLLAESVLKPTVLLLEDSQWFDSTSRELLTLLTQKVTAYPIALILTSRFDNDGQRGVFHLSPDVPLKNIDIKKLSGEEVLTLSENIVQGRVSDAMVSLLISHTESNPYFIEQMLLYFKNNNLICQGDENIWTLSCGDGKPVSSKEEMPEIPTSIKTVLIAQIDSLPSKVKEIVQSAAVIGREFDYRILDSISTGDISSSVRHAELSQILIPLPPEKYTFKNILLHEVMYAMQLRTRLREIHLKIAEAIELLYNSDLALFYAKLAYHYDKAMDDEKAGVYYQKAAIQAADRFSNDEALGYIDRALEKISIDELQRKYELLTEKEHLCELMGKREEQASILSELGYLVKMLKNDELELDVAHRRANYLMDLNKYTEARILLGKLIEMSRKSNRMNWLGKAILSLGRIFWQQGDYKQAANTMQEALDCIMEHEISDLKADAFSSLGLVCGISGDADQATEFSKKALEIYSRDENLRGQMTSLNNLGIQARRRGDFSDAIDYYEQASQIANHIGAYHATIVCNNNLALVLAQLGAYDNALAYLKKSHTASRDLGEKRAGGWALAHLGLVYHHLGLDKTAHQYARQALELARESKDPDIEGYALLYLGHALKGLGKLDEAGVAYREAAEVRKRLDQRNLTVETLAGVVDVALRQGKADLVSADVEEIIERLQTHSRLEGASEPFWVHFIAYRYLKSIDDERHKEVLEKVFNRLQEHAAKIRESYLKESFLHNVDAHKKIVSAFSG